MKKIVILCGGGSSSEREVSLRSGRAVFEALKLRLDAELFELSEDVLPENLDPKQCIIFPMIHGEFGEDGQLQTLLEAKGFRYCGSDASASRLCMDKAAVKDFVRGLKILTPQSFFYGGENFSEIWERMGGPFVIKPNNRGSSIGVAKIYEESDFIYHSKVFNEGTWIVETCIEGREITVGILGTKALPAIEIRAKNGFYDYRHKYTPGLTEYLLPAPITAENTQNIQSISEEIFKQCGCRNFARLDFILTEEDTFYFLEINTIPGMTATSLLPKAAGALGISFENLCLKMLELAIKSSDEEENAIIEKLKN